MTTPEFTQEQPATLEQASDLLREVGTLTTLQGKNYRGRNIVSVDMQALPPEVAEHLPEAEALSSEVKDSAHIVQMFDRETGQPKRDGVVGMVIFTRTEKPDANLSYAVHANYHLTTEDGGQTYGLERHVTNIEHGPHKAREMRRLGRAMLDPAGMLNELPALRDKFEASRSVEVAMGISTVSQTEAQQVIDFVSNLNAIR
jgi:hypothetical protein